MQRHHRDLLRLLRGITRNQEDAEDLTQEAFLRAFRALDRFDLERPFRPWFWTIGIRLALQAIAKKERRTVSLEATGETDEAGSWADGPWMADLRDLERMEGKLLERELLEALETITPHYRTVLVLRALEEKSYEEISAILDIPVGTVMSRLNRARSRLRERLVGWSREGRSDGRKV